MGLWLRLSATALTAAVVAVGSWLGLEVFGAGSAAAAAVASVAATVVATLGAVWASRARADHVGADASSVEGWRAARIDSDSSPGLMRQYRVYWPYFDGSDEDPAIGVEMRPARNGRFVNVVAAEAGTSDSVPFGRPLGLARRYDVLVSIGEPVLGSLLPLEYCEWPQDRLPLGDLRLRAVLRMDGWSYPMVAAFTLPQSGDSFACGCREGARHDADCRHDRWVRFSITTPSRPQRWAGELAIYYQAVVVHAQRLILPTGTQAAGGPRSHVLYQLTNSFANMGELADRTASVLISGAGSRLLVNGVSFVDNPVSISTGAVDDAARTARDILYDIHMQVVDGMERSRYDAHHRKSQADFEADLRLLARAGAEIYEALFSDPLTWSALPDMLRHEARARRRPPVVCIASAAGGHPERHVPWSVIYDLPVGGDPASYQVCPSVRYFGPNGSAKEVPAVCPVHHADYDVLCLFGFWGLSCLIEQPPSGNYDLRQVVADSGEPVPVSVLAVTDPGLNASITLQHVTNLKERLRDALTNPAITSGQDLARALGPEGIDVAYLYCHYGYQQLSKRALPSVVLRLGVPSRLGLWMSASGRARGVCGQARTGPTANP